MIFRWNAKAKWGSRGESPTTLIMWMGSVISVLIIVTWLAKNIYPIHVEVQLINDDLENLQYQLSGSCNSFFFNRSFNPRMNTGTLMFDREVICIKTDVNFICRDVICNTHLEQSFCLENVTLLSIVRMNGTINVSAMGG